MFGSSPINMECPNCRAQVTTGKLQWKTDYYVCLFIFSDLIFGNKQLQTDHYHQIAEMFKTTLSISSNCWGRWHYCLGRSWSHVCSWWVISSSSYCIITQFPLSSKIDYLYQLVQHFISQASGAACVSPSAWTAWRWRQIRVLKQESTVFLHILAPKVESQL